MIEEKSRAGTGREKNHKPRGEGERKKSFRGKRGKGRLKKNMGKKGKVTGTGANRKKRTSLFCETQVAKREEKDSGKSRKVPKKKTRCKGGKTDGEKRERSGAGKTQRRVYPSKKDFRSPEKERLHPKGIRDNRILGELRSKGGKDQNDSHEKDWGGGPPV